MSLFILLLLIHCISVRWLHLQVSNNWTESTTTTTSSYSTEHAVITNSNSGLCTIMRIVQPASCIRRECVSLFLLAFYLCDQSVMLADTHDLVRTFWNGSAARIAPKCLEDESECNQKIPLLGSSQSWTTDNFLGSGPSHAMQMSVSICASVLDHFQHCRRPTLSLWGLQPWCFLSRF